MEPIPDPSHTGKQVLRLHTSYGNDAQYPAKFLSVWEKVSVSILLKNSCY